VTSNNNIIIIIIIIIIQALFGYGRYLELDNVQCPELRTGKPLDQITSMDIG